jgi:hypothetical protein
MRRAMTKDLYFQHYAAANRISQELLWDSVIGSINRQLPELIDKAKQLSGGSSAPLESDPKFEAPRYVTAIDIHCMPGGYAGEASADDIGAGALYDRGVYLYAMGYMGPNNDDMGRSVTNYLRRNMPDFKPRRILDMGCTVGHSTLPLQGSLPRGRGDRDRRCRTLRALRPCPRGRDGAGSRVHAAQRRGDRVRGRQLRPRGQSHPAARNQRPGDAAHFPGMPPAPRSRRRDDPRRSSAIRQGRSVRAVHSRQ